MIGSKVKMPPEFSSEADSAEQNSSLILSFVVRIWIEAGLPDMHRQWRGQITVVKQDGGTAYTEAPRVAFDDFNRMSLFMFSQLEHAGVRIPWRWRIRRFIHNRLHIRIIRWL